MLQDMTSVGADRTSRTGRRRIAAEVEPADLPY
jgi:hypothetical protein